MPNSLTNVIFDTSYVITTNTGPVFIGAPSGTTYTTTNGHTNFAALLNGAGTAGDAIIFSHGTSATHNLIELAFEAISVPTNSQIRAVYFVATCEYLNAGDGAGDLAPNFGVEFGGNRSPDVEPYPGYELWGAVQIGIVGSGSTTTGTRWTTEIDKSGTVSPFVGSAYGAASTFTTPQTIQNGDVFHLRLAQGAFDGQPEVRMTAGHMVVEYNQAPSATVSVSGGTNTPTLTPTITWTYSDPENDIQERYKVTVLLDSDNSIVYQSGEVISSAIAHAIPNGYLLNNTTYRVKVEVADAGSAGRYNIVTDDGSGAADHSLTFTTNVDPLLMPVLNLLPSRTDTSVPFDASTGGIGPLYGAARLNLLTESDARFYTGGAATAGAWAVDSDSAGTPTIAADTTNPFNYASILVTAAGATTAVHSAPITGIQAGMLLTAQAKVGHVTNRRAGNLIIRFYSDAGGTTSIGEASCTQYTTDVTSEPKYATWSTITRVPPGAASARLVVKVNASVAAEQYRISAAHVTTGAGNLLDDAGFDSNGFFPAWHNASSGASTFTYVAADTTGTNPESSFAGRLTRSTTDLCRVQTHADFAVLNGIYLVSADIKSGSSSVTTLNGGFLFDDASTLPASQPAFTGVATTIDNYAVLVDCTGVATARHGSLHFQSTAAGHMDLDSLAVEKVAIFYHGDFEDGTPTASLPLARGFGDSDQQNWMIGNALTGSSTVTYDSSSHGGSVAAKLLSTAGDSAAKMEQWFSVQGWTSLTVSWWSKSTTLTSGSAVVEFFDAGGTSMGTTTAASLSGTVAAYAQTTSSSIGVPLNAAWARLIFTADNDGTNNGTLWVDDVVVTSTGMGGSQAYSTSYAAGANHSFAPATPYIDGGWSAGGVSTVGTPSLIFERSNDQSTWTTVRQSETTPSLSVPLATPWTVNTTDYEFDSDYNTPGNTQHLYYRAAAYVYVATDVPARTPDTTHASLSKSNAFVPSEWLLIDPLSTADTVALQVKKAKFDTPEAAQTFTLLGRNRRIVVGDKVLGDTITLDLQTITHPEWQALQTQMAKQRTLVLRSPDGDWWYVRTTKRSRERVWTGSYTSRPLRNPSITFEQTDAIA